MLQNFRFARYRFTYTVQEPLKMPPYKGNVFRGRFGYILRHIACIGDTEKSCEKKCQHPDRCVYSKCFETPVPDDSPMLRGQPFAPHPFILKPPRTGKQDYAPGDTFTCNMILIGEAINLLPWIVLTFREIGKWRIGLRGERGQCQLEKVESLPAYRGGASQTIYTAETEMLADDGLGTCSGGCDTQYATPGGCDWLRILSRRPVSKLTEDGPTSSHLNTSSATYSGVSVS